MMGDNSAKGTTRKSATAARMYDYYLGGIHNFPADQEAAREIVSRYPFVPGMARANRAFLARAVRHLVGSGIRQILDIGSGIPTEGNVHEIAQAIAPDCRVVYVDIDPVAVSESLEILEGNEQAIAVRADLREPSTILEHPAVRRLLDFTQPVGVLMACVLHFVPDDALAYPVVEQLLGALAPDSYLVVSHTSAETFMPTGQRPEGLADIYAQQTATPGTVRTRAGIERFFTGLELLDPGVVWIRQWRPDDSAVPAQPDPSKVNALWAGVGVKR
jgi:hypothetical protein